MVQRGAVLVHPAAEATGVTRETRMRHTGVKMELCGGAERFGTVAANVRLQAEAAFQVNGQSARVRKLLPADAACGQLADVVSSQQVRRQVGAATEALGAVRTGVRASIVAVHERVGVQLVRSLELHRTVITLIQRRVRHPATVRDHSVRPQRHCARKGVLAGDADQFGRGALRERVKVGEVVVHRAA